MTNEEDYIYDFAIMESNVFAIDYRKLSDDKEDFNTYESESLVIYNKSDDIKEGTE